VGSQSDEAEPKGITMTTTPDLFSPRSIDRGGADSTVYLDGAQRTDGTVEWSLYVLADDRKLFTAEQARQFAAMIFEAADELDGLQ
jgi:hypothetical protein